MPVYEYECPTCGPFERSQKITEPSLTHHECGSPVQRKISLTAFALKGGGWSSDGYAAKNPSLPPCRGGSNTSCGGSEACRAS